MLSNLTRPSHFEVKNNFEPTYMSESHIDDICVKADVILQIKLQRMLVQSGYLQQWNSVKWIKHFWVNRWFNFSFAI